MMYVMRRTNIYLDERQLDVLNRLAESRDESVASLVREAIDTWLDQQGVESVSESEWEQRFRRLLDQRLIIRDQIAASDEEIDRDVIDAVRAVRQERAARRH
jgi:hypothetical protein